MCIAISISIKIIGFAEITTCSVFADTLIAENHFVLPCHIQELANVYQDLNTVGRNFSGLNNEWPFILDTSSGRLSAIT